MTAPINNYPVVVNGGPVDASLWFNPVAQDLTALGPRIDALGGFLTGAGSLTSSGAVGAETVDQISAIAVFKTGRVYEVRLSGCLQIGATANRGAIKLRKGTTTAGTLWADFGDYACAPGLMGLSGASIMFANNTGADISTSVCTTLVANAGTLTWVGQAQQPRGFSVWDVGSYATMSGAAPIALVT